MAKKIDGYIKLQVPAGTANPSPPIGPALGQRGVNIMEFFKSFNAATDGLEKGMPIPTTIQRWKLIFSCRKTTASIVINNGETNTSATVSPRGSVASPVKKKRLAMTTAKARVR